MTTTTNRHTHNVRFLGLVLAALVVTLSLHADATPAPVKNSDPRFAIGAEIGSVGYGPAVIVTASKNFTATFGYTWFSYDYDLSNSHGDFNAKLKLSNLQALLNWHPFAGSFHLTAGAFICDNKVTLDGVPQSNSTFNINDVTYTTAQVGNLSGTGKLVKGAAPFLGLGWSKKPTKSGFGCFFDLGVLFMSSPEVSFNVTGPIRNDPTFQSNLHAQEQKTNKDLKPFKYYPVIQFGLLYRF